MIELEEGVVRTKSQYLSVSDDNYFSCIKIGSSQNYPTYVFVATDGQDLSSCQYITAVTCKPAALMKRFNEDIMAKVGESSDFRILYRYLVAPNGRTKDSPEYLQFKKNLIPYFVNYFKLFSIEKIPKSKIYGYISAKTSEQLADNFFRMAKIEKTEDTGESDIKVHNLNIHIESKVSKPQQQKIIDVIEKSYKILQKIKLENLMTGNCYVTKKFSASYWGLYNIVRDYISVKPNIENEEDSIHTFVHEMGHKFMYKFMSPANRKIVIDKYVELMKQGEQYTQPTARGNADEVFKKIAKEQGELVYVGKTKKYKSFNPYVISTYTTEKMEIKSKLAPMIRLTAHPYAFFTSDWENNGKPLVDSSVSYKNKTFSDSWFPTAYSRTNFEEFWAEIFAFYATGKFKNKEVIAFVKSCLK